MKTIKVITKSALETKQLAEKLAEFLFAGSLVTLSGQLGAGKTTFTQGLGKGLNIKKNITSPSFTLLKIYQGDLPLYHIDAYRLEGLKQDLGFEEYIAADGVCVIEWSNFISDLLPKERINIEINILEDDSRELLITANGKKYERILEKLCIQ
ncbi:MAG TPA: tRNA (adenosine(37)-N6)-threonylcarbamoyltransferase complex ATPase subunit type 1 TsaE [Erysipelotrichaceae bacterium]|nr:tRNA (adenosine(37)-N6)-threonylcarbamoyltransferase complex ATPase subunit type 1 TsaE [Erysipelotrichaceae bacterium]HQA84564.1 tRNA (adenosine(37)-N6)-threonylcarbamoyltransferase complex ATPase subunit type 1 TsaE [Erysipelotrichaceae bacterium]